MEFNEKKQIKTIKKVYPQIYSYKLTDERMHDHDGWQKIGYTERLDVDERIHEQVQTAAIRLNYQKLWSSSSIFISDHTKFFTDKDLHKYYVKNSVVRSQKQEDGGFGEEWFYFNGTPEKSKELFDEFARRDFTRQRVGKITYSLRKEQENAVSRTLAYAAENQTIDFEKPNEKAKFLWNAKPRFGKTLSSYDFAKRFNAKNVLIVTNRPAIANSWYDDFKKFIDGYYFISTTDSLKLQPSLSRDEFLSRANPSDDDRQITFLSLQDLKGGKIFGGGYDKLKWVADLKWDLLIIDEAHEGIDTEKTEEAFRKIKRRFTLHLSGTPFKAIADGYFTSEQIYNWTYIDEQKAKKSELANGDDAGDHVNLPDMRLFTYKMSDMIESRLDEGIEIDDENIDYAFELNDMFSTDQNGKFIHEREILTFLDQLALNEKYPFSTPEMRDELKHTFWLVGNRVASAKAMERLLRNHPVFSKYKIVLAAGDGKPSSDGNTSEEEMQNIAANEKAYDRVKRAIQENDRTITLSVGQLTTGVTIEEWSAVLMLSDIKSESLYMQAIFRSQNPYKYTDGLGDTYRKKSAYVFDFSPNRVLKVYDKFANSLLAKAAQGEITEKEREANVAELLNYFPVLAEDKDGEMVELNAEQVLTFPKAIIAKEVVNRGFVTNLLFVNINNVFNIPSEIISALNKASSTNDTGKQVKNEDVEHNPNRQAERNHRISVNKDKILGNKVYGSKMQEIVATAVEQESEDKIIDRIVEEYIEETQEPFAVYKAIYSPSNAEFEELQNRHFEKVKEIAEEYVDKDLTIAKTRDEFVERLSDLIEKDLPNDTVVHKEEENYKEEELSEMDQIRKKLRTFTRAIPSFVMASKDPSSITLDNIENTVSDEDFETLFTENDNAPFTKDDFRMIRGPWTNPETGEKFEGFFDRYVFNAAIREFEEKRKEVADYLLPGAKEDIFSYIRPLKTNQIFTPRRIVNQMLDLLEEENPGIFDNPDATFADLYVKSGLYLTEIAKRLNRGLEDTIPDRNERIKHIFEKQLYGFAPTKIIYDIAHKYIYGLYSDIDDNNFKQLDLTSNFKKGETLGMKFTAVVGNPPYQENIPGRGEQPPIYNFFLDSSYKIADIVCMIHPARFLFNAGKTPIEWNKKMLDDEHLRVVFYEQKSNKIFSNTDIKGGVAITIHDNNKDYGKIGTFIHIDELRQIKDKVSTNRVNNFSKLIYSNTSYKYASSFFDENPSFETRVSGGSSRYLSSSVFEKFPEVFFEKKPDDSNSYASILGLKNLKREFRYFAEHYLNPPDNFKKFKVLVPASNGSGAIGEVLSTPLIGQPLIGHTETFISIGCFDTEEEANNCLKYIKTKFARVMLGIKKITQGNKRAEVWSEIPLQDFSNSSDIDWSKSISYIDGQLNRKYNLSKDEINYIEEKVQVME